MISSTSTYFEKVLDRVTLNESDDDDENNKEGMEDDRFVGLRGDEEEDEDA